MPRSAARPAEGIRAGPHPASHRTTPSGQNHVASGNFRPVRRQGRVCRRRRSGCRATRILGALLDGCRNTGAARDGGSAVGRSASSLRLGGAAQRPLGSRSPPSSSHSCRSHRLFGVACCHWFARKLGWALRAADLEPLARRLAGRCLSSSAAGGRSEPHPLRLLSRRSRIPKGLCALARLSTRCHY